MNARGGTKDECCVSSVSFVFWVTQFHHINIYCYKLIIPTDLLSSESDTLELGKYPFFAVIHTGMR